MGSALIIIPILSALAGASSVSGTVLDERRNPVYDARVFIEPGLGGVLVETRTSADGAFAFQDVRPGGTGVFAIAEGYAFGGRHVEVALADTVSVVIRLGAPGMISGRITSFDGSAVEGARVTRVGLLGASKVGIPLAKLAALGFREPVSDAEGCFTVPDLRRRQRGDKTGLPEG